MRLVARHERGRGRRGQALVEYSLILALVSVLSIAILGGFGEHVRGMFLSIMASLAAATNPA